MHKRNICLITIAFTITVLASMVFLPFIRHSNLIAGLHYPAFMLAVLLSGPSHSPTYLAGGGAFISYSLFLWLIIVIVYALLVESYIIWSVLRKSGRISNIDSIGVQVTQTEIIDHIGSNLREVERRRRKHIVLSRLDELDLNSTVEHIALIGTFRYTKRRPYKKILGKLKQQLTKSVGSETAALYINHFLDYVNQQMAATRTSSTRH